MSINFAELKTAGSNLFSNAALFAIILGESGAGKSSTAGTTGEQTLHIHTVGESHGAKAAKAMDGDVTPYTIDFDGEQELTGDEAWDRLMTVLKDAQLPKVFGTVVIDSASEIEDLIRRTSRFKSFCTNDKGRHNEWDAPKITSEMFKELLNQLKRLQMQGVHVIVTCAAYVREVEPTTGAITLAEPSLKGSKVAENLVRQFDDVLLVGPATIQTAKGEERNHWLQFAAEARKQQKDEAGNVKKTINFNPRVSGIKSTDLKEFMRPDLRKIIEIKRAKLGGK